MKRNENPDCKTCAVYPKSVFCALKNAELEVLNQSKSCQQFKKGEYVFRQGSYPRGLHCINNGKLKLIQEGADGKEQILHLAKSADIMGYRAILSGDRYSCSAIAVENSSICFIPNETFFYLIDGNSRIALQIIHLFSKELKIAESKITHMAQRPAKERIAQSLLQLKENYGFENDGKTLNILLSREEIANISATTRETVTRILFDLKNKGIIELQGKKIKILEINSLLTIANTFS